LLGHMPKMMRDPLTFFASLSTYGSVVRIRLGPGTAFVVCDPDLVQQVLVDDRLYDKGGPVFESAREVIGNGLASCPHSEHRRQRRLLTPIFHGARNPDYARTMTAEITAMTDAWRDSQVLDVKPEMARLTSNFLMKTMFSEGLAPEVLQQCIEDLTTLLNGTLRRAMAPAALNRLPTPGNRRFEQANVRLRSNLSRVVADRRRDGDTDHGDMMSVLLAAGDPTSDDGTGFLTEAEIVDQVVTMYGGGVDSTATALAWTFHLLAQHPLIEKQLHAEVDAVLGGGAATDGDLANLPVTGRIIAEVLRLYPPAPMVQRMTSTGATLGGHSIPAGATIICSPYVLHHRGDVYSDPERFDPDRWNNAVHPPPPRNSVIAFGAGARKCIGDRYALTSLTLTLATVAARWSLSPAPRTRVRPTLGITLTPRGLRMLVTARGTHDGR
jgi:cytochrome P450